MHFVNCMCAFTNDIRSPFQTNYGISFLLVLYHIDDADPAGIQWIIPEKWQKCDLQCIIFHAIFGTAAHCHRRTNLYVPVDVRQLMQWLALWMIF